jgi:hypothetical protein
MMSNRAPSLIEQLQIRQEPRGDLGRLFLVCDQALTNMGLTARICPMEDLVTAYEANKSTWNGLTPIFDSRYAPIDMQDAACMLVYDRKGDAVASGACRKLELGARSVADASDDLTLFYGAAAPTYAGRHRCDMSAPSAKHLRGTLVYYGGLWVRPDFRRSGACEVLREASRYYAATQWVYSHEFSVGAAPFLSPSLQKRYAYSIAEPSVSFFVEGHAVMKDGLLVGVSYSELMARLGDVTARLAEAAQVVDRDQQRIATG